MKKYLLLFAVAFGLLTAAGADAADKKSVNFSNVVLKKSTMEEPPNPAISPENSTFPQPFSPYPSTAINPTQLSVSTGYYFVDSPDTDEEAGQPWHPDPEMISLAFEENNWRRIIRGPELWRRSTTRTDVNPDGRPVEGYRYFHNPFDFEPHEPEYTGVYDSTDNAFAGPMPIGFDFVFGGVPYDSFYVSTNGVITLSNRRYFYNTEGDRQVLDGGQDCYNPMSMDWFADFRTSRTGTGLDDLEPDYFGFYASLFHLTENGRKLKDILNISINAGGQLLDWPKRAAVIAPFWGSGYLSQTDKTSQQARDYGQVHFYKNSAGNKLVIYYKNYTLVGNMTVLKRNKTTINCPKDQYVYEDKYIGTDCQVVLDRTDSSVAFNYGSFKGRILNGDQNEPNEVFRWNTVAGLFNRSRTPGWNSKTGEGLAVETSNLYPWFDDYPQWVTYWDKFERTNGNQGDFPANNIAVKFKQWKNTLRYIDIQYRVRPRVVQGDGEYTEDFLEEVKTEDANNYELLAGHPQIGQIQPVILVQNLTNDRQGPVGVNYQPQDLEFKVRMVIKNLALEKNIYNKAVDVDSLALATREGEAPLSKVILSDVSKAGNNYIADNYSRYQEPGDPDHDLDPNNLPAEIVLRKDARGQAVNGVPPYGYVQVYFPPFEPNEFYDSNIGRMQVTVKVEPIDPHTNSSYKDMWPFDDKTSINLFVMRRFEADKEFSDDGTEWHQISGLGAIPSVLKWVSIDASIVNGEEVSRHALPPRGKFLCKNDEVFNNVTKMSPAILLNRPSYVQMGQTGGAVIRSFPIDMTGKYGATLSLAIQRTSNPAGRDWRRNWSDEQWVGCESRIVKDSWDKLEAGTANIADELRVEFALPSPDGVQGIANIDLYDVAKTDGVQEGVNKDKRWRYHTRRGGAKTEENMSAFSLYGGGGYIVGFLETDKDSAMAPPNYTEKLKNGLRSDFYDDGIDYEFKRFIIPIPDTIINAPAKGAENFRFRIKAHCKNHQPAPDKIGDDSDNFIVDNIRILIDDEEKVDLEVTSVSVKWPYTITPASQAIEIPVTVKITNNTVNDASAFWIKVRIYQEGQVDENGEASGEPVYCRIKPIHMLRAGQSIGIDMPSWNARETRPDKYTIIANVWMVGRDVEVKNDTTFTDFETQFGPVFAYEPISSKEDFNQSESNVADLMSLPGRGLNLFGYAMGGAGSGAYDATNYAAGRESGSGSGQIAMKFRLEQADTVYGFQAFFTNLNMAPDEITIGLYEGSEDSPVPGAQIPNAEVYSVRGWDDIEQKDQLWSRYVTYLLKKPVILSEGTYWIAIAQLGETGLELGASSSAAGIRVNKYYVHNPNNNEYMNGSSNVHLMIEKRFRKLDISGNLVNDNMFAVENTKGSGTWEQFMPTGSNPAYANNGYNGLLPDGTKVYARGTWLPLLRPYLGNRLYAEDLKVVPCEDIIGDVPVELSEFDGVSRGNNIDLMWATKSEQGNKGFYVERRNAGTTEWSDITFVDGMGTTSKAQNYNFTDKNVVLNNTYQYRLRQVDIEGTSGCDSYSQIISVKHENTSENAIAPNWPNPFTNSTNIEFNLNTVDNVTVDILDIYGNVVKNINNNSFTVGLNTCVWDGNDNNNVKVGSGTYVLRVKVAEKVMTRKMSLVK